VHRDALDADLDAILPVDVVGVAAFTPNRELKAAAVVGEDAHLHHALPVSRVVEDDQELLGEVLEDLDVVVVDVELVAKGVPEVMRLCVVAVAVEPAHGGPVDELVMALANVTSGRHSTVATRGPSPRVAEVLRHRHGLLALDHL
jgi:hypothetical protein